MATFSQAVEAKTLAYDALFDVLRMRPGAVGVVSVGQDDYGLKITLPREPNVAPPVMLYGVPIAYYVEVEPPALLSAPPNSWRARSLARRK
jgi:hypothetical protein